ncbi:hypothetical protein D9C73_022130 [Collichthys lucidus]|uniref:Uncharacterized protein n=1 Tax=Collichthys lucidus TaxID=240159 RepID=A0A4U5VIK8_COLLU|nr:hypothetical protein D9C73_022130 [Collichthys lucidus]
MGCSPREDNSPVVDPEQQMIYTLLEKGVIQINVSPKRCKFSSANKAAGKLIVGAFTLTKSKFTVFVSNRAPEAPEHKPLSPESLACRYHGPLRQASYDSSGKVGQRWQQAHDGEELLITDGEINHSYTERKRERAELLPYSSPYSTISNAGHRSAPGTVTLPIITCSGLTGHYIRDKIAAGLGRHECLLHHDVLKRSSIIIIIISYASVPQDVVTTLHNLTCNMMYLSLDHTDRLASSVLNSIRCPCLERPCEVEKEAGDDNETKEERAQKKQEAEKTLQSRGNPVQND